MSSFAVADLTTANWNQNERTLQRGVRRLCVGVDVQPFRLAVSDDQFSLNSRP